MNSYVIPSLNNQDEFHNWCLDKAPIMKLEALVQNWDALIGGACLLQPTEARLSVDSEEVIITFETLSDKQRAALSGFQALLQRAIGNSNLKVFPQSEGEGSVVLGEEHGYLSILLGVASQSRHMVV